MDKITSYFAELLNSTEMSEKEISEKTGIQIAQINRIKNGEVSRIQSKTLFKLSDLFQVPTEKLEELIKD